jgi:hypothetical protein
MNPSPQAEARDRVEAARILLEEAAAILDATVAVIIPEEKPAAKPYPDPPPLLELPRESVAGEVAAFYGQPSAKGEYLAWFEFPSNDTRLYSRMGDRLQDRDGNGRDEHRAHKSVCPLMEAALLCLWHTLGRERYMAEGWHVWAGAHAYRTKKLGGSLSMHAWAVAADFNPGENPLHARSTTFSAKSVAIMERYGWLWGPRAWGMPGYGRKDEIWVDPMHWQMAIPHLVKGSYYAVHGLPQNIVPWRKT